MSGIVYTISRCLLCRHAAIDAVTTGRTVTTSCPACHAVLKIEFDPPDQPELRARIVRIDQSEGGEGSPLRRGQTPDLSSPDASEAAGATE
jgi:hypothetical protein